MRISSIFAKETTFSVHWSASRVRNLITQPLRKIVIILGWMIKNNIYPYINFIKCYVKFTLCMLTVTQISQASVRSPQFRFSGSLNPSGKQVLPWQRTQDCKPSDLDLSDWEKEFSVRVSGRY